MGMAEEPKKKSAGGMDELKTFASEWRKYKLAAIEAGDTDSVFVTTPSIGEYKGKSYSANDNTPHGEDLITGRKVGLGWDATQERDGVDGFLDSKMTRNEHDDRASKTKGRMRQLESSLADADAALSRQGGVKDSETLRRRDFFKSELDAETKKSDIYGEAAKASNNKWDTFNRNIVNDERVSRGDALSRSDMAVENSWGGGSSPMMGSSDGVLGAGLMGQVVLDDLVGNLKGTGLPGYREDDSERMKLRNAEFSLNAGQGRVFEVDPIVDAGEVGYTGSRSGLGDLRAKTDKATGLRPDGNKKGAGFLGELKNSDGSVSTEYSVGVPLDGVETDIPTLVPTLTKAEIKLMTDDIIPNKKEIPPSILKKAVEHARERKRLGYDVFFSSDEVIK